MAVVTLAGQNGSPGFTDGTGTGAQFDLPSGLASDGADVYVCDTDNDAIRKVTTPAGVVTTLFDTTDVADLNGPEDVAIDDAGNLWVANVGGGGFVEILRIEPGGASSTPWAVSSASATFGGIAVNPAGDLALWSLLLVAGGVRIEEVDHPYDRGDETYTYADTTEDVQSCTYWNGYWWALRRDQNGHDTEIHRFTPEDVASGPTRIAVDITGSNYLAPTPTGLLVSSSDEVVAYTINGTFDGIASEDQLLSSTAYGTLLAPTSTPSGVVVSVAENYLILIEAEVSSGGWRVGRIGFPSGSGGSA